MASSGLYVRSNLIETQRQLEGEARQKAAIGAEAKWQAEAELERSSQARQKARQKEEAEAGERELRLDQTSRARLQAALTSLGVSSTAPPVP